MKTLKLLGLGLLLCSGLKAQESKFLLYPDQSEWKSSFSVAFGSYDDYRFPAFMALESQHIYFNTSTEVQFDLLMRYGGLTSRFITQGNPVKDFGLDSNSTSWMISNSILGSYRPAAYTVGYQFYIKPWLVLSTQLSHIDFGLNFQSYLWGNKDAGSGVESWEELELSYQYRLKAIANTYQLRLQSPYLWKVFGVYVQGGLGLQFNFAPRLTEESKYKGTDSSSGSTIIGYRSHTFEAIKKTSLDPLFSPWEIGISLWMFENLRLEGFYRVENNMGSAEMAPTNNTIVGFNLVVNAAVLR